MKTLNSLFRLFFPAVFLAACLCLTCPAQAGSWIVTYEISGTNTGYDENHLFVADPYRYNAPWDSNTHNQFVDLDLLDDTTNPGGDNIHSTGDVTAVCTWTGGAGDPPPDVLYVSESASASADAPPSDSYQAYLYDPVAGTVTPISAMLSVDDGLGDAAYDDESGRRCGGAHLRQIATHGQPVVRLPTRHFGASIYYADPSALIYGLDGLYEDVQLSYSAAIDNRAVTISSDIDQSYYKSTDGDTGGSIQLAHTRNPDGSMQVDAAVVPNMGFPWAGGYHADVTYTANPVNFSAQGFFGTNYYALSYVWSHPGGTAGENVTPASQTITVHYDFGPAPNAPSTPPLNASYTTSVLVGPDTDGATGNTVYTVNWHYPYENWAKFGHNYQLTPLMYTSNNGPQSAAGFVHITTPPNSIDYSIPTKIGGGVLVVGASLFAPELDPLVIAFLNGAGYAAGLAGPPPSQRLSFTSYSRSISYGRWHTGRH